MAKEVQLMEKDIVFHKNRDLCFSVATALVIAGVTVKFMFASSVWVIKHRMAPRERT